MKRWVVHKLKSKKGDCTSSYKMSMSSFLDNVSKKRLSQFVTRLCRKKKAVIDSLRKRKLGNEERKRKLSSKKSN